MFKKFISRAWLSHKNFGGHQHWGWMMTVFSKIMVGPVKQVLKACSFTEKWLKPVPQGSMSVREGVRVRERRSLRLPSTKYPSLRLSGFRKNNRLPSPEKWVMFGEVELEVPLTLVCASTYTQKQHKAERQHPKLCSPSFADVILPIVITLIVITLSVFSLVALYKMCQKNTPGIWFAFSASGEKSMCFLLIKDLFRITLAITVVVVWWESFLYFVFCLKWETNTSFSKSVGRPVIFGEYVMLQSFFSCFCSYKELTNTCANTVNQIEIDSEN